MKIVTCIVSAWVAWVTVVAAHGEKVPPVDYRCWVQFQRIRSQLVGKEVRLPDRCGEGESGDGAAYAHIPLEGIDHTCQLKLLTQVRWNLPDWGGKVTVDGVGVPQKPNPYLFLAETNGGDAGCEAMTLAETSRESDFTVLACQSNQVVLKLELGGKQGTPEYVPISNAFARITAVKLLSVCHPDATGTCPSCQGPGPAEQQAVAPLYLANSSVHVGIPFGRIPATQVFGGLRGHLSIEADEVSPALFSPLALRYVAPSGDIEVIRDPDDSRVVRQVKAVDGLADVVVVSTNAYDIRVYSPANVTTKVDGLWQTTGSPALTYTVQNGDPTSTNSMVLQLIRTAGGASRTNVFRSGTTNPVSTLEWPGGLSQNSLSRVLTNNATVSTQQWVNTNTQALARRMLRVRLAQPWGSVLATNIVNPGTNELSTVYEHYTDPQEAGYGMPRQVVTSGGGWRTFVYDGAGRIQRELSGFLDQGITTNTNLCRAVVLDYGLLSGAGDNGSDTNRPRTTIHYLLGQEVAREYLVLKEGQETSIQCVNPGAAWNDTANLVRTSVKYTNGSFAGLVAKELAPDGTMTFYEYGTNSTTRTNIVWHGQPNTNQTTIVDGTRTVTLLGLAGQALSEKAYDVLSGAVLRQQTYTNYDEFYRPGRVTHLDGTWEDTDYGCCGVDSVTDRDGVTTSFVYDDLGRKVSELRLGIRTEYTYDAAGQILTSVRRGTNDSPILREARAYDLAGRVIAETNAVDGPTVYSYGYDGSGRSFVT